jgi:cell division protein FtsX
MSHERFLLARWRDAPRKETMGIFLALMIVVTAALILFGGIWHDE